MRNNWECNLFFISLFFTNHHIIITASVVVRGQTRIVAASNGSSSPSPSKRKFNFQNNRTCPYEPQIKHLQHGEVTPAGKEQQQRQNGDEPTESMTVGGKSNRTTIDTSSPPSPPVIRPAELLHRRKLYIQGPRQIVGSTSSEFSTAVNNNHPEAGNQRQNYCDQPKQQSNSCRQISPASCNSESVASSAGGGCGLCGLMPQCAIRESGSSGNRKIRGNSTIVEEEATTTGCPESGNSRLLAANRTAAGEQQQQPQATTTTAKNHRMSKFNSSSMDRSVDSIGSCSLDVDADSTDFSGSTQLINLLYPLC